METVNDYAIYITRLKNLVKLLEEDFLHADTDPERYKHAFFRMPDVQGCVDGLELIAFKHIDK